jgi:hypothetical protein
VSKVVQKIFHGMFEIALHCICYKCKLAFIEIGYLFVFSEFEFITQNLNQETLFLILSCKLKIRTRKNTTYFNKGLFTHMTNAVQNNFKQPT